VIEHIRSIRAEYRVPPKTKLRATIVGARQRQAATFEGERETIVGWRSSRTWRSTEYRKGVGAHAVFGDGSE